MTRGEANPDPQGVALLTACNGSGTAPQPRRPHPQWRPSSSAAPLIPTTRAPPAPGFHRLQAAAVADRLVAPGRHGTPPATRSRACLRAASRLVPAPGSRDHALQRHGPRYRPCAGSATLGREFETDALARSLVGSTQIAS
jgi:hypothetical protein